MSSALDQRMFRTKQVTFTPETKLLDKEPAICLANDQPLCAMPSMDEYGPSTLAFRLDDEHLLPRISDIDPTIRTLLKIEENPTTVDALINARRFLVGTLCDWIQEIWPTAFLCTLEHPDRNKPCFYTVGLADNGHYRTRLIPTVAQVEQMREEFGLDGIELGWFEDVNFNSVRRK